MVELLLKTTKIIGLSLQMFRESILALSIFFLAFLLLNGVFYLMYLYPVLLCLIFL